MPTTVEAILLDANGTLRVREPHAQAKQDQTITPDAVVHSLGELLDIFPASVQRW